MSKRHISLFTPLLLLWLLAFASPALAGPPTHLHNASLDIGGFNHACGVAVDSEGDVYVASAGESKVKVFNPAHTELTSIANANEPCGLAVNSKGELFVSEKATGKVVRYKPNVYPFSGAPTYGAAEPIDSSGDAKGIAVDPHDDRLYVAEGDHIAVYKADGSFEADVGVGTLSEASGVAAYTYASGDRYLFAADAAGLAADAVHVFSGNSVGSLKLRRTIDGPNAGEDFGFGASGAYLAVDPGNRSADQKCASVAEQACTAGHLLVYDEAHDAVDEFDATGEFLDQFTNAALADAEPTALAVDRSGGPGDGTIYVSAGSGPGSELLAFGPLAAPSRAPAPALSRVLVGANAVATDSHGNVYVAAGAFVHVYGPEGEELTAFEDTQKTNDLAVDSTGKVYVLDLKKGFDGEPIVTYYAPSAYPPVSGTTYARHEPPVAASGVGWPAFCPNVSALAVNPANDHLFVTTQCAAREYDSAANGSVLLNGDFAGGIAPIPIHSIAVDGASGNVYFGSNPGQVSVVNAAGTEVLARINGAGSPKGKFKAQPFVAVDQSNGHALVFQDVNESALEYDASGAFVAEFGKFSNSGGVGYRIAVDNSCALHDPPLTETTSPTCKEFDPADGTVYVAFDDAAPGTFDVTAFGPLAYGEPPLAVTGVASGLGAGNATLNGTVNPNAFDLTECKFEYLSDDQYLSNGETFAGATSVPCAESIATIGKGTDPVAVHADISGLDPEERQRFRLVARNKYGESEGEAVLFGPPVITTKTALPILYTEATLRARIDPSGLATTYHFEYGETAGVYDHATATKEFSSATPADVQAPLTGLAEGTTYHFRVVAENEARAIEGPDQTVVTLQRRASETCPNTEFRTGLSARLPDCRAYELVTPAETNGLSPYAAGTGSAGAGFNNWLVTPRGGMAGESFAFFTDGTLAGFEGNGKLDGYRAKRGIGDHPSEGWSSELFAPSYVEAAPSLSSTSPLQQGVAPDQRYSFWNVEPAEAFEGTLPDGIYLRTPSGFEVAGQGSLGTDLKAISRYVSAGGTHVIFVSEEHLEGEEGNEAPPVGTEAIYDRAAGSSSAKVVSLLPGEVTPGAGQDATYIASTEDGSAVAFKVGGALYLRRNNAETVQVAAAPNTFAGVSEDGRRVFYTATANGSAPGDLFACDVESGSCAGPEAAQGPTLIAEDSVFVNVSADGSGVLFTTEEASEDNLYAWDGETEASGFVAVLDPEDFEGFGGIPEMRLSTWTMAIGAGGGRAKSPTRSTPGGTVFVFQSHAQLTSYDNEGHGEIYRYDPAAVPAELLLCVSCDPSGAPAGADAMLQDTRNETGLNAETLIPNVTDDGRRVFFSTPDRLLPEDANDVADVYEWQAKGSGGCDRATGCLALISSGQGERPSYLYGMSADGHDVFFRTREKLVGQDVPGSPSLYDARVEGGIPDPPAKAPCQGDACQGNGSIPPVIQSPASTTIRSSGNTGGGEGSKPRCGKGQRKVRRAGKTRCVKKQQRKSHRKRSQHRTNHNGRAHR